MFDTVGRYRDPEGPIRRIAAGCLTLLAVGGTLGTILAVWLAAWLWPWIKALLLFVLHALFGRAPAFLLDPVVIPTIQVAEIEVGLAEPWQAEDPALEIPPLPGEAPAERLAAELAMMDVMMLGALDSGPEIAHLRGWNDDDDFAVHEGVYDEVVAYEEVASVGVLMMIGSTSSDSGELSAILGSSADLSGMWGDEVGDAFGAGGLGLSGIGEGGGGTAEGIGGLGTIGTIGRGGGGGTGSGYGSGSGRLTARSASDENARRQARELPATDLVAELGYDDNYASGGLIGSAPEGVDFAEGVEGGVAGGVLGGVVGGVVGGTFDRTDAEILEQISPDYPEEALAAGLSGRCSATVKVNASGRGSLVSVSGCDPLFRAAVAKAVERSRFRAATEGGEAVSDTLVVRFVFNAE